MDESLVDYAHSLLSEEVETFSEYSSPRKQASPTKRVWISSSPVRNLSPSLSAFEMDPIRGSPQARASESIDNTLRKGINLVRAAFQSKASEARHDVQQASEEVQHVRQENVRAEERAFELRKAFTTEIENLKLEVLFLTKQSETDKARIGDLEDTVNKLREDVKLQAASAQIEQETLLAQRNRAENQVAVLSQFCSKMNTIRETITSMANEDPAVNLASMPMAASVEPARQADRSNATPLSAPSPAQSLPGPLSMPLDLLPISIPARSPPPQRSPKTKEALSNAASMLNYGNTGMAAVTKSGPPPPHTGLVPVQAVSERPFRDPGQNNPFRDPGSAGVAALGTPSTAFVTPSLDRRAATRLPNGAGEDGEDLGSIIRRLYLTPRQSPQQTPVTTPSAHRLRTPLNDHVKVLESIEGTANSRV